MRTAERQERRTHNIVSFTPPKTKTSVIMLDSRIPRNLSRSTVMPPNFKDPISWGNSMIHSMIGMWCYKESNTAGLRYFWLQPWSRLLCWSKQRPSESKRKNLYRSTFIQSFSVDAEVILINSHKKSKSVCFRPAPEDKDIWLDSIQRTLEGDLFPLLTN